MRGRYSAHRCERQFRGDTHLTFLCRVSRPTPCFSYSTHVFNFNIALRCMCLREDLDQKSSPRSRPLPKFFPGGAGGNKAVRRVHGVSITRRPLRLACAPQPPCLACEGTAETASPRCRVFTLR